MAARGLDALDRRLDKVQRDVLSGKAASDTAREVGFMAKGQTGQLSGPAALGGDRAFSGWRRGAPIELTAAFSMHQASGGVTIHRGRAAGPWRVAEEGRNRGNGGGGGFFGPGVGQDGTTARTKTGRVRKVRARGPRRWNGTSPGFGSWTEFEAAVLDKVPETVGRKVRAQLSQAVLG